MADINIIREPLLMDDMVSGLCLCPDLSNPEAEKMDLMDLYRIWARIPNQTHSCNVAVADGSTLYFDDTDALLTFEKGIPVGVKTADCVPILIYASDVECVGAVHAGWKGTLGGIVDNVMDILDGAGADPSRLKVAFGPSISKDVYEVDHDLAERFRTAGFREYVYYPSVNDEKPHIDLQGANMERFLRRGVRRENVSLHSGCCFGTRNNDGIPMYASHRRSGGAPARMLTSIMMLSESEMAFYRRLRNQDA
ncbi:MAG: polyphenol oxidase family protein [Muribaculaceae bacterium]|nr:polyphenol oxidase family protein [Muribaculaceae bacterium]